MLVVGRNKCSINGHSPPFTTIVNDVSDIRNTLRHEGKYASHNGLAVTRQHDQVQQRLLGLGRTTWNSAKLTCGAILSNHFPNYKGSLA
jgi:hypothetical protein